uniref:Potassium voltage-gated channel subfamily E regulatory subunit 3 n=1 Tax=Cynoglossus semilaevis TaxID=244447 RepID=A0A3P8WH77_CYNSE
MNRTLLLSLLSRCQQILENHTEDIGGRPTNTTDSNSTVSPDLSRSGVSTSSRETYDNAYFYIMVVMFFYTFLAMSLFKCFVSSDEDKKDPYEEFINTDQSSRQKFNAEKFDFEDESSL